MDKAARLARLSARYYGKPGADPLDQAFCEHARAGMRVLDAGCGAARGCARESPWEQMYIVGIDAEKAVGQNPFCNAKAVSDVTVLPFADGSFDLIHCRWVLEHLADPGKVFREFMRVLKPGGRLLALTPNVLHYSMTVSMCTPNRFHRWWKGEESHHFPTCYRANSPIAIRRLCTQSGLRLERLHLIEGPPRYFNDYPSLFLCGVLYERIVNSTSLLRWLRFAMVLEAVRPPAG